MLSRKPDCSSLRRITSLTIRSFDPSSPLSPRGAPSFVLLEDNLMRVQHTREICTSASSRPFGGRGINVVFGGVRRQRDAHATQNFIAKAQHGELDDPEGLLASDVVFISVPAAAA